MSSVSATSVTAAAAVVSARATQAAALAALNAATTALHLAATAYRQSMANDGVDPVSPNAPITLTVGDTSGVYVPNY